MLSSLRCFLFMAVFTAPLLANAQVSVSDSLALVDLYNSTNGPSWENSTNWLTTKPLDSWRGVTVKNNRVTMLNLQSNHLRGKLPASIGNLTALSVFQLSLNGLKGSLPSAIGNMKALTRFEAYSNLFSGRLPSSIGNLPELTMLLLSGNILTGSIPSSLGNLPKITNIDLAYNQLTGSIPSSITKLSKLVSFNVATNELTGVLPPGMGSLSALNAFDASDNNLSGTIPQSLYKCRKLQVLTLTNNRFSGGISDSIAKLDSLTWLFLNNNQFSGSLPLGIGHLKKLQLLYLQINHFAGSIPDTLRNCSSLTELRLDANELTGILPPALAQAPVLSAIRVSSNQLTGDVPLSYFDSSGITELWADNNHLSTSKNFNNNFTKQMGYINLGNNNFTFDGLEFIAQKVYNPYYDPQPNLTIHRNGDKLAVSAGGTLKNNTYYWTKAGSTGFATVKHDSTYTPAASGHYTVQVSNAIATRLILYSDTFDYKANAVAPIAIGVSPNPANDYIVINNLPVAGRYTIVITDMTGLVKMQVNGKGTSVLRINVAALQKGNYYLKLAGNEVASAGAQFIKE